MLSTRLATVVVWATRLTWLLLAAVGGAAFGDALASHTRGVQLVATITLWTGWAVVAAALAIPSTVSLTVTRSLAPVSLVVAVMAAFGTDSTAAVASCVGLAALSCGFIATGEFGQEFVQQSAYGDEQRFVLRPTVTTVLAVAITWPAVCAGAVASTLLLGAGQLLIGVPVAAATIVAGWFLAQSYHRLSRRWIVLVPAGLVIHDQLVLAETVMLQRSTISRCCLAPADTQAADLTGPATGHAVEVSVREMVTIVRAGTRATPGGTALHASAMLVAPTRPGNLLRAAAANGLPVG